jgi:hypothetical protein
MVKMIRMKTALYGRMVFGVPAVLFGVIALMWHDADTWQNLQHIWSLPFGTIIGRCLMTAQIAGMVSPIEICEFFGKRAYRRVAWPVEIIQLS